MDGIKGQAVGVTVFVDASKQQFPRMITEEPKGRWSSANGLNQLEGALFGEF